VPPTFGDAIETVDSDADAGSAAVTGASDFMPRVTLPGLRVDRYPEYLAFLYRATMAAVRVEHPGLFDAIDTSYARYLTAVIVAVRVGVWASTGVLPIARYAPVESAVYYDAKRDRLWLQGASSATGADAWRLAYRAVPEVKPAALEAMLLWCKVAPLILCTACTGLYALSNTYSTPFVDDAMARYLRATASADTQRSMRLDRSLVWDTARAAAVDGMPERLVHAWTDDPLLAVTAERRIMTSEAALRASRLRGERVRAKLDAGDTVLNLVASDPGSVEHQKALWEAVARAKEEAVDSDDDNESVATALLGDSSEGKLGLASLSLLERIPEEEALTPGMLEEPPEVSIEDRAAVARIVRNAHSSMEQPASIAGNLDANMPVAW
jgi:hypothetical protein